MKKLFPILLLTICSTSIFSQFTALPVEGTRWSMTADFWTSDGSGFYKGYSHQIMGDTIINNLNYKKVYHQERWYYDPELLTPITH